MAKIIVVGSNHAGTAAVNTILQNYGENNEVIVFDRNSNISFLGCGMALWIGNQIDGPEGLFYSSKEALEKAGAKVNLECEVSSIDYDKKIVYAKSKDGKDISESYDKLILATGSLPIIPRIEGIDLENVMQVKLYQDAEKVIEKIKNPEIRNISVVGAGYIGVELAEAFQRHGKNVNLIDIADTVIPSYYDEEFTDMMKENLKDHGINLNLGQEVKALRGTAGKVEKVITNKGEYDADMVILAIGFKPNNYLGKDRLKLFKNGSYLVNSKRETSEKNVYAIGDCSTIYNNATEEMSYIALATNAVRTGIVAAHNACGTDLDLKGVQGSNGICIYDLKLVSTGITLKKAKELGLNARSCDYEDLQKPGFIKNNNEKVKIKIVYNKDTREILGAQLASKYDISMGIHMFSLAIQEKVTIDKLALTDIFFLPHFNQPYNYITMAALSAE